MTYAFRRANIWFHDSEPEFPRIGHLWVNTSNNTILNYDGSDWIPVSGDAGSILAHLTESAPEVLDTITEIAAALDNNPNILDLYLTSQTASATYQPIGSYLTQASASATYQPVGNYLTQSSASATYLTQSSASATYLTQSSASATYLTQSSASATYLTQSTSNYTPTLSGTSMTFNGGANGSTGQTGNYVLSGKVCNFSATITMANVNFASLVNATSGASNFAITLPVNAAKNGLLTCGYVIKADGKIYGIIGRTSTNSNSLTLWTTEKEIKALDRDTPLGASGWLSTTTMHLTGTYQTV